MNYCPSPKRYPRAEFNAVFPVSGAARARIERTRRLRGDAGSSGAPPFSRRPDHRSESAISRAELVREKIVRQLGDELPYSTAVEIEAFKHDERGVLYINALFWLSETVRKNTDGESGGRLKSIGTSARRDMERAFDSKVMLKLWVKVKSGWSDDIRALKTLGLDPQGDQ